METRRQTATHILEWRSWPHVSDSNGDQEAHGNSHAGRDVMAARQRFQWRPGGARQLTSWKGCHGRTSAIPMETRRRTATHKLEWRSWPHVSDLNGDQEAHGNSQTGMEVMAARQRFQWRPGGAGQLTSWKRYHGCTSAIPMETRRRMATHTLEGMSWPHVSDSNRDKEAHGNSQSGRDITAARQRFQWRPGGARQLTSWNGGHGRTSVIPIETRRRTATHNLEGTSATPMETRRRTATHNLEGISWPHVSDSNGDQEAQGNSHPGRDVMAARQ